MGDGESQFCDAVSAIFSCMFLAAARSMAMKNKNSNNSKFQKTFQRLLNYKLWSTYLQIFFLPNYFLCSISGVGLVCGRCLVMNIQLIAKTANVLIYACVAWRSFRIGSRWFVTCSFINLCEIKVRFTFTWLFGGVLYIWLYRGLFNQAVGKTWVADQAGGKMRICDSADVRILNM